MESQDTDLSSLSLWVVLLVYINCFLLTSASSSLFNTRFTGDQLYKLACRKQNVTRKRLLQAMYRHRASEGWTAALKLGFWLQVHSLHSSGSQPEPQIFGNVWGNLAPPESFGSVWKCVWLPRPGILLTPARERPRMLLNPLQCTEQPPTMKNYMAQNVNSAKFEKLCSVTLGLGLYM